MSTDRKKKTNLSRRVQGVKTSEPGKKCIQYICTCTFLYMLYIVCTMHKYWSINVRILFPDTCTNLLVSVVIGHGSLTSELTYLPLLIAYVCFMVINVTFNNFSVISWQSVLLVEEAEKLYHIMLYTSP